MNTLCIIIYESTAYIHLMFLLDSLVLVMIVQWCSPNSNCSISKLTSVPKRAFNVKFVPLIASSPISKQITYQFRLAITRIPLYVNYQQNNYSVHLQRTIITNIQLITINLFI